MSNDGPKAAVIDCDGVLYNYSGELASVAAAHLNRPLSDFPPAEVYDVFFDQWNMTLAEYLALVEVGVRDYGFIRHGTPFDDSVEGIDLLLSSGVIVDIATDMGTAGDVNSRCRARLAWFVDQGLDTTLFDVTFTASKHEVAKRYLDLGLSVFGLEDKVENFRDLNDVGARCYLLDQKYNQQESTALRVSSVLEFAQIVTTS
jgi:hypothetical protein